MLPLFLDSFPTQIITENSRLYFSLSSISLSLAFLFSSSRVFVNKDNLKFVVSTDLVINIVQRCVSVCSLHSRSLECRMPYISGLGKVCFFPSPTAPLLPPFPTLLLFFLPFWNQHYSCLRTFSYISNFHYVHFVPFPVYSEMKPIACSLHCFSSSVISILLPCDIDFNCYCIFSLSSISCLESLTFSSFLVFLFMLPCFSFQRVLSFAYY